MNIKTLKSNIKTIKPKEINRTEPELPYILFLSDISGLSETSISNHIADFTVNPSYPAAFKNVVNYINNWAREKQNSETLKQDILIAMFLLKEIETFIYRVNFPEKIYPEIALINYFETKLKRISKTWDMFSRTQTAITENQPISTYKNINTIDTSSFSNYDIREVPSLGLKFAKILKGNKISEKEQEHLSYIINRLAINHKTYKKSKIKDIIQVYMFLNVRDYLKIGKQFVRKHKQTTKTGYVDFKTVLSIISAATNFISKDSAFDKFIPSCIDGEYIAKVPDIVKFIKEEKECQQFISVLEPCTTINTFNLIHILYVFLAKLYHGVLSNPEENPTDALKIPGFQYMIVDYINRQLFPFRASGFNENISITGYNKKLNMTNFHLIMIPLSVRNNTPFNPITEEYIKPEDLTKREDIKVITKGTVTVKIESDIYDET